jgi:hypothetical protein
LALGETAPESEWQPENNARRARRDRGGLILLVWSFAESFFYGYFAACRRQRLDLQ